MKKQQYEEPSTRIFFLEGGTLLSGSPTAEPFDDPTLYDGFLTGPEL